MKPKYKHTSTKSTGRATCAILSFLEAGGDKNCLIIEMQKQCSKSRGRRKRPHQESWEGAACPRTQQVANTEESR